ncbi:MAG: Serine/threonine-protein kinase PknB [Myxococcaceae bacterium]|nr:Serine/threonine-protein kinase PknB [Myxococcaceae bacterium]
MSSLPERSPTGTAEVIAGRFELRGRLFEDGFGEVLDAFDRKTNKPVTLRRLRSEAITAATRTVLRSLGSFHDPHVVSSFGVIAGSKDALLVQGPLTGQPLGSYVASRRSGGKPVSLRGAYNVVAHVCNALTAIHAIEPDKRPHGAVRPGAVWIGEDGRVLLADLVIARAALGNGGTGGLSEAEAAYLAPELKGGGVPTRASDIFGLGALLYVLLTGRSPLEAFIAPSQAHPEATAALDHELLRALAPDPRARHATPEDFRAALFAQLADAEQETTSDFGVEVEVEVNLQSLAPSRRPSARTGEIAVVIPQAARVPQIAAPAEAGMRVSMNEAFRPSLVEVDHSELEAARERRPLGEVDLKNVLAKITEDDSPRWMVVKNGMDHGPFSGRQLVNMILKGEALSSNELLNSDTGVRGKLVEFAEFKDFVAQYELRRSEADRAQALASAEKSETRGAFFKIGIGLAAVVLIGAAGGLYALSRSGAGGGAREDADLEMYKRGELEVSGSAGILPIPKPGARRSGARSSGGSGSGASYEDAMMQAVDLGSSATGGGEQQLSAGSVAGVMNKHLNQLYGACVHGNPGKVTVDIAIQGSGNVLGVSVNGGDASLQRCVADQVRRIHFPSFSAPRMGARYSFGS